MQSRTQTRGVVSAIAEQRVAATNARNPNLAALMAMGSGTMLGVQKTLLNNKAAAKAKAKAAPDRAKLGKIPSGSDRKRQAGSNSIKYLIGEKTNKNPADVKWLDFAESKELHLGCNKCKRRFSNVANKGPAYCDTSCGAVTTLTNYMAASATRAAMRRVLPDNATDAMDAEVTNDSCAHAHTTPHARRRRGVRPDALCPLAPRQPPRWHVAHAASSPAGRSAPHALPHSPGRRVVRHAAAAQPQRWRRLSDDHG